MATEAIGEEVECVLRTRGLTKKYKDRTALREVDLSIRRGSIYGFIGQNGAGKSTLMKIVAGLVAPTSGTVELFGRSGNRDIGSARARIGMTIESPALFPAMTAWENMEVQRRQKGIRDREAIGRTLELVGLKETGRMPAGEFSLGMKQRLDLAVALLGEPELLILDEPTNGLDPTGVVELRDLLKRLNGEAGTTILVSSHILSELRLLATHYGIIHKGRLLEQLTASELSGRCRRHLLIRVDEPSRAAEVLERELGTAEFDMDEEGSIRLYRYEDEPIRVSSALAAAGLGIERFGSHGESLEGYFVRRIGEESADE